MKTVSFLTLALTAAAIASPLTWERLIESAKADCILFNARTDCGGNRKPSHMGTPDRIR